MNYVCVFPSFRNSPRAIQLYHTRNDVNEVDAFRDEPSSTNGSVQIRRPISQKRPVVDSFLETLKQACFPGDLGSARCVQRFDDSLNLQFTLRFALSLRSSSMRKPRDPLLKVVSFITTDKNMHGQLVICVWGPLPPSVRILHSLLRRRGFTNA